MSEKTFVLDTNVLLHDPECIVKFPRHKVVLPVTVLEELDGVKRLPGEIGKNSREVIRFLDSLKSLNAGNLHEGVRLSNGSTIQVQIGIKQDYNSNFALSVADNRIIMAAARC